jgi:ribosomal protein S18 acetylase RimI-like enzyme
MAQDEVRIAVEWAAQEGWNPGLHDSECYYAADPSGFLLGLLEDEPIATISVVKYGATFGFLGFYIVAPQHRGQGYGFQVWNAGLKYLAGRTIGLDGVVAQQDNYKKSGFRLAYRNIRFEGIGGGDASGSAAVVPLASVPFEMVRSYSLQYFPEDRSEFLKCWIDQPASYAVGIMHGGSLAGYGVMRACRTGYKIGPLFAENDELATLLFLELRSQVAIGEAIFLDVPEVNERAVNLAERYKMNRVFETARMYNQESPDINVSHTFGVTSFEVG